MPNNPQFKIIIMRKKIQKSCPKHEKATPDFSGMAQNEKKHPHLEVYHISQRNIPGFINGELQVLIVKEKIVRTLQGLHSPTKKWHSKKFVIKVA